MYFGGVGVSWGVSNASDFFLHVLKCFECFGVFRMSWGYFECPGGVSNVLGVFRMF